MIPRKPKVTVLMSVFNGERYLSEAIDSILRQTFTDFEFLIINDGSTDSSTQIIEEYHDSRICLIHNPINLGLAASLNKGMDLAQGQYIARMDDDDISHPERLRKQVEFMDKHPKVGVCGTWVEIFGEKSGIWRYPISPHEIRMSLLFESALAHPSVVMRKSKLKEHNLNYNSTLVTAQDFDLWLRCGDYFPLANLPEILLKYRITPSNISRSNRDKRSEVLEQIHTEALTSLNLFPKKDEYEVHHAISTSAFSNTREFVQKVQDWLLKLHRANLIQRKYSEPSFSKMLAIRWFRVCHAAKKLGTEIWRTYWQSPLSKYHRISWRFKLLWQLELLIFKLKQAGTHISS